MYQKVSTAIFVILVAHMELPERLFPALHVDSYRIRDFLNTKEDIWTYNTTKTNVIRCRIGVELLGQFSRRRLGRMYVFREGHPLSIETLTYKAPDCSCGVVVVRSLTQGTTYVDLRVRNSFIRDGPRYECRREFSRITHYGRVIYSSDCSQNLRNTLV
uniref:Lipocalin n=1 Tax=Rhipicephalus appendiculatus TaxID=34631 RepID=A0A131Z0U3_RHIAP